MDPKYNLIIIPSSDEKGISFPNSTLHAIFWDTIKKQTAQFVTILPTNYFIYQPTLYYYCQMFVTDELDYLAFEQVKEVYGFQLDDHVCDYIKSQSSLQHVRLIKEIETTKF